MSRGNKINLIEEAISKNKIKYYDYKHFNNIQEIGVGDFGKVYRANWKNSKQFLALKYFYLDKITVKELVHEFELQREVMFHDNFINFYGITNSGQGQYDKIEKYLLVMKYADGSTLRNYLKKNFNKLSWKNKYNLANQLACAVSCLHNEGIIHGDLHSSNILIHQDNIKLADFGLSKRIEESSNKRSGSFGMIPYVDPQRFSKPGTSKQPYHLNEKSDVYSVGVLLWEISNGQPPFYVEGKSYDDNLAKQILQGHRESIIPDTPADYVTLYTECWDGEPNNRPSMHKVDKRLEAMILQNENDCENFDNAAANKNVILNNIKNLSYEELSQLILNFNTKEVIETFIPSKQITKENLSNLSFKKDLSIVVKETVKFIFEMIEKGKDRKLRKQYTLNYFNNSNMDSSEIYYWLLKNQADTDFIFLLGYFNFYGIEVDENYKKAFNLFIKASEQNHILAQYYVGVCYFHGYGTIKNDKLVFKYYKKLVGKNCTIGLVNVGHCYDHGIGTNTNKRKAVELYQKSANLGNVVGQYNLGIMYEKGDGVNKDYKKAFELFKQSAEKELPGGILMLGYCYSDGIGTNTNKQKAVELYQKAANLGNEKAMYNLANMYKNGEGVNKDYKKAFELFKQSAEGEHPSGILMLGYCYDNRIGTNTNKQKAVELYQKAANLGNEIAMYNLGFMYEKGDGIVKDIDKAIYWYEKSAKHGYQSANNRLNELNILSNIASIRFC